MSVHTRKKLHKWYAGILSLSHIWTAKNRISAFCPYPRLGFPNFHWFACNFNEPVLEAQWELDHELGCFWYLLIPKRSFLAVVAVPSASRRSKSYLEVGGISPKSICTGPLQVYEYYKTVRAHTLQFTFVILPPPCFPADLVWRISVTPK